MAQFRKKQEDNERLKQMLKDQGDPGRCLLAKHGAILLGVLAEAGVVQTPRVGWACMHSSLLHACIAHYGVHAGIPGAETMNFGGNNMNPEQMASVGWGCEIGWGRGAKYCSIGGMVTVVWE